MFQLGETRLATVPGASAIRCEIVQSTLQFHAAWLRASADDPALRREAVRVRLRLADLRGLIGENAEAEVDFRRALAECSALLAEAPNPGLQDVAATIEMGWTRESLPDAWVADLLKADVYRDYASRPELLRERLQSRAPQLVVLDEVQKVPALLDEVHWLIEDTGFWFLLTGSSARKLRTGHANLLAGRAWRWHMTPLAWCEVPISISSR